MDVAQIEEWRGREVLDSDGRRIGKLEDLYYARGTMDARVVCVRAGLLGRGLYAVPLAGARAARDHLIVAFTKATATSGLKVKRGHTLGPAEQRELSEHFGTAANDASGADYASAKALAERVRARGELAAEIEHLDEQARRKRAKQARAETEADAYARDVEQIEELRRQAETAAARLAEP